MHFAHTTQPVTDPKHHDEQQMPQLTMNDALRWVRKALEGIHTRDTTIPHDDDYYIRMFGSKK